MNEGKIPGEMPEGVEEQAGSFEPPAEDFGGQDLGGDDSKINRGNKGMLIAFLIALVLGGAIGVLWWMDREDHAKWKKEYDAAMSLPDGEFEAALRSLMERTDREDILTQVALELGIAKDKQATPLLAKAVTKGGELGRESAKALAKIGGEEAKVGVEPIYGQMTQAKELAKAEFAWALCMLGDDRGFQPLLEAIGTRTMTEKNFPDFNPDIITRMGTTDRLINDMATSNDDMLKMYAAMELGFRTDADVVPALLKLVKDPNDLVAQEAAISLGRTTDERAGPALLQTMEEKRELRDTILASIAQSVGSPGLNTVYKNIKNDAPFKYKIIGKLKKLRDPRSTDLLLSILNEEFPGSDKEEIKQGDEIRNQALWTLEELGEPRIAEAMFEKTQWTRLTEEQMPDPSIRYRQDDMSRKIANGIVSWFGKVQPEGVSDYLLRMYDFNKPYSNTPECAQRVTVDIGPVMDAMGRTNDKQFCKIIEPFLDQDEGFYFQAASFALARLNCDGVLKSFITRMQMTKEERKEEKFASLLESRDWQMEERLQERRNSIMAVKFFGSPEPGETLMEIVLDPDDDKELRQEAASSLAYCADEAVMDKILETIKDEEIDVVARAALIKGLWHNPSPNAVEAMFQILEGEGTYEFVKTAAIVIGEAGDSANDERLNKLLSHPDETRQRAAAFAIMLGGKPGALNQILELLNGEENKLVIRDWYENHPIFLSKDMFDSKRIYKRLVVANALAESGEKKGNEELIWSRKYLMQRIKNGWEDGPGGLTPLEIRNLLAETVRNDDEYRELAANILAGLSERGYLLALQGEKGPQSTVARDMLLQMNTKSQ